MEDKIRTKQHGVEMDLQRSIHKEDTAQVEQLSKELERYRKENEKGHKEIFNKVAQLDWLAHPDFKDAIIKLVKDEQGRSWLMIKIAAFLKYASIVIAIFGTIFGIFWAMWKNYR